MQNQFKLKVIAAAIAASMSVGAYAAVNDGTPGTPGDPVQTSAGDAGDNLNVPGTFSVGTNTTSTNNVSVPGAGGAGFLPYIVDNGDGTSSVYTITSTDATDTTTDTESSTGGAIIEPNGDTTLSGGYETTQVTTTTYDEATRVIIDNGTGLPIPADPRNATGVKGTYDAGTGVFVADGGSTVVGDPVTVQSPGGNLTASGAITGASVSDGTATLEGGKLSNGSSYVDLSNPDQLVLHGGTTSTTQTLDNSGVTFTDSTNGNTFSVSNTGAAQVGNTTGLAGSLGVSNGTSNTINLNGATGAVSATSYSDGTATLQGGVLSANGGFNSLNLNGLNTQLQAEDDLILNADSTGFGYGGVVMQKGGSTLVRADDNGGGGFHVYTNATVDGTLTTNGISNTGTISSTTFTDGVATLTGGKLSNGTSYVDLSDPNKLVLHGGTTSTTQTLDNTGVTFADSTNGTTFRVDNAGNAFATTSLNAPTVNTNVANIGQMQLSNNEITAPDDLIINFDAGPGGYGGFGGLYIQKADTTLMSVNEESDGGTVIGTSLTVNGVSNTISGSTDTTLEGGSSSLVVDDNGVTVANSAAPGGYAQIHGVANGTAPHDAVNVGQLHSAINNLEEDLSKGIAATTAMANIPQVDQDKTFAVGVGVGNYNSETAIALGASVRFSNNGVIKGSVGHSGGETAVGLGAALSW